MKVEMGSEVVPRSEVGLVLHWCKRARQLGGRVGPVGRLAELTQIQRPNDKGGEVLPGNSVLPRCAFVVLGLFNLASGCVKRKDAMAARVAWCWSCTWMHLQGNRMADSRQVGL